MTTKPVTANDICPFCHTDTELERQRKRQERGEQGEYSFDIIQDGHSCPEATEFFRELDRDVQGIMEDGLRAQAKAEREREEAPQQYTPCGTLAKSAVFQCEGCGNLVLEEAKQTHDTFHVYLRRVAKNASYATSLRPLG